MCDMDQTIRPLYLPNLLASDTFDTRMCILTNTDFRFPVTYVCVGIGVGLAHGSYGPCMRVLSSILEKRFSMSLSPHYT